MGVHLPDLFTCIRLFIEDHILEDFLFPELETDVLRYFYRAGQLIAKFLVKLPIVWD